ncbi:MAG: hypothetical protein ACRDJM_08305 [Actinomycetota bacterium]
MPGVTADQYDGVMKRLEQEGLGPRPAGPTFVAAQTPDGWLVVDMWDSPQQLEAFAARLIPIAKELDLNPQPAVYPAHNVVAG